MFVYIFVSSSLIIYLVIFDNVCLHFLFVNFAFTFYAAISKFTLMSPAASSNNGSMSSPLSFFSPENKNFVKIKAFFNVLAQL